MGESTPGPQGGPRLAAGRGRADPADAGADQLSSNSRLGGRIRRLARDQRASAVKDPERGARQQSVSIASIGERVLERPRTEGPA